MFGNPAFRSDDDEVMDLPPPYNPDYIEIECELTDEVSSLELPSTTSRPSHKRRPSLDDMIRKSKGMIHMTVNKAKEFDDQYHFRRRSLEFFDHAKDFAIQGGKCIHQYNKEYKPIKRTKEAFKAKSSSKEETCASPPRTTTFDVRQNNDSSLFPSNVF